MARKYNQHEDVLAYLTRIVAANPAASALAAAAFEETRQAFAAETRFVAFATE